MVTFPTRCRTVSDINVGFLKSKGIAYLHGLESGTRFPVRHGRKRMCVTQRYEHQQVGGGSFAHGPSICRKKTSKMTPGII